MKYPYRPFPLNHIDPVTKLDYAWRPALKVLLWYQHKKSAPIESILDTGADHCIFDAQIGDDLGIPITKGMPLAFTGIGSGETAGFLHSVTLTLAAQTFQAPLCLLTASQPLVYSVRPAFLIILWQPSIGHPTRLVSTFRESHGSKVTEPHGAARFLLG